MLPENEVEEEVDSVEVSVPAAIQENTWAQVGEHTSLYFRSLSITSQN